MRVHRNLHNARRGGPQWVHTVKGRVSAYLDEVRLTSVTTRIQPAGAAKCAATQVRSVCAFFDGQETSFNTPAEGGHGTWQRIGYDPRKDASFMADGTAWNAAAAVELRADGSAWVLGPRWEA